MARNARGRTNPRGSTAATDRVRLADAAAAPVDDDDSYGRRRTPEKRSRRSGSHGGKSRSGKRSKKKSRSKDGRRSGSDETLPPARPKPLRPTTTSAVTKRREFEKQLKQSTATTDSVTDTLKRQQTMRDKFTPQNAATNKSLCCLTSANPLRRACIQALDSPWFDRIVVGLIIANTISLMTSDPTDKDGSSAWSKVLERVELVFNIAFTLEMMIKIIAMGFVGNPSAYLRDAWNRMDFVVVIGGWLPSIIDLLGTKSQINPSALRTVRVLKVLRTINSIPTMRTLVKALLDSIPMLSNVLLLLGFIFFIFGILGVQFYGGLLNQWCYDPVTKTAPDAGADLCSTSPMGRQCPAGQVCRSTNYAGQRNPNPQAGFLSFDNIFVGWLAIFTSISLEGWVDLMYYVTDTAPGGDVNIIYFILLVMLGALFGINLVVAVIFDSHHKTFEALERKRMLEAAIKRWGVDDPAGATWEQKCRHVFQVFDEDRSGFIDSEELGNVLLLLGRRLSHEELAKVLDYLDQNNDGVVDWIEFRRLMLLEALFTREKRKRIKEAERLMRKSKRATVRKDQREACREEAEASAKVTDAMVGPLALILSGETVPLALEEELAKNASRAEKLKLREGMPATVKAELEKRAQETGQDAKLAPGASKRSLTREPSLRGRRGILKFVSRRSTISDMEDELPPPCTQVLHEKCGALVRSPAFNVVITLAIVANTIILSLEHFDQSIQRVPEATENLLEIANYVFTAIFSFEMVAKLIGLGLRVYVSDAFNIFDAIVVVLSLLEIVLSAFVGSSAPSGFSVLRGFRLLRVFKLAQSWQSLRALIETVLKSGPSLANFSCILLIFIIIYSLLGMELFGGNYKDPASLPRLNFNSLHWAVVTVFVVLSGENWNEVMYDHMEVNSWLAAIFFVTMFVIGNFIALNLFLAILLQNFESATPEEKAAEAKKAHEASLRMRAVWEKALPPALYCCLPAPPFDPTMPDVELAPLSSRRSSELMLQRSKEAKQRRMLTRVATGVISGLSPEDVEIVVEGGGSREASLAFMKASVASAAVRIAARAKRHRRGKSSKRSSSGDRGDASDDADARSRRSRRSTRSRKSASSSRSGRSRRSKQSSRSGHRRSPSKKDGAGRGEETSTVGSASDSDSGSDSDAADSTSQHDRSRLETIADLSAEENSTRSSRRPPVRASTDPARASGKDSDSEGREDDALPEAPPSRTETQVQIPRKRGRRAAPNAMKGWATASAVGKAAAKFSAAAGKGERRDTAPRTRHARSASEVATGSLPRVSRNPGKSLTASQDLDEKRQAEESGALGLATHKSVGAARHSGMKGPNSVLARANTERDGIVSRADFGSASRDFLVAMEQQKWDEAQSLPVVFDPDIVPASSEIVAIALRRPGALAKLVEARLARTQIRLVVDTAPAQRQLNADSASAAAAAAAAATAAAPADGPAAAATPSSAGTPHPETKHRRQTSTGSSWSLTSGMASEVVLPKSITIFVTPTPQLFRIAADALASRLAVIDVETATIGFYHYNRCFTSSACIQWLIETHEAKTRQEAIRVGRALVELQFIEPAERLAIEKVITARVSRAPGNTMARVALAAQSEDDSKDSATPSSEVGEATGKGDTEAKDIDNDEKPSGPKPSRRRVSTLRLRKGGKFVSVLSIADDEIHRGDGASMLLASPKLTSGGSGSESASSRRRPSVDLLFPNNSRTSMFEAKRKPGQQAPSAASAHQLTIMDQKRAKANLLAMRIRRRAFVDETVPFKFCDDKDAGGRILGKAKAKSKKKTLKAKRIERKNIARQRALRGISLFFLGPKNKLRVFCTDVILNPWFDRIVFLLIAVSSVLLALDNPHKPKTSFETSLFQWSDIVLTVLFTIECILKIVSMGFFFGPDMYLRDGWNVLDFGIVCISVVNLLFSSADIGFIRSLRALRALRPLRVVSRNEGMRMVVGSIIKAMPAIVNVGLVSLLFFLVFGILGINFFKGKLAYCHGNGETDQYSLNIRQCVGVYANSTEGAPLTREWKNGRWHFDDIGNAVLTLFEVSSMEMWPDIMLLSVDATAPGEPMKKNAEPNVVWFYVFFVIVCGFFVVNLFVGVVIDKFSEIKEEMQGSAFTSEGQRRWAETQRLMLKTKPLLIPRRPDAAWRLPFYRFSTSTTLEVIIMTLVILNVIVMAVFHIGQPAWVDTFLMVANLSFLLAFVIEAIVKVIGLGWRQYISQNWNKFDFVVIVLSLAALAVNTFFADSNFDASLLRVLRVARIFRLIPNSKGLRALFETLIFSLPSLGNVGSLLLLLFFVYAVMGVNLFGNASVAGEFNDRHANFATFGTALLTLFRCSTGESWNGIMHDVMSVQPFLTVPYFVSFIVLGQFMMLNLFIAVILENFSSFNDSGDGVSADHVEAFTIAWSEAAGSGEMYLPIYKLPSLLFALPAPIGFNDNVFMQRTENIVEYIRSLQLSRHGDEGDKVFYLETLFSVCGRAFGDSDRAIPEDNDFVERLMFEIRSRHPTVKLINFDDTVSTTVDITDLANATIRLQREFRRRIAVRRAKAEAEARDDEGGDSDESSESGSGSESEDGSGSGSEESVDGEDDTAAGGDGTRV